MPALIDLRSELEKGEILRDMGADEYTAVKKNEYGKYVYMCCLDPRQYFQTFEELVACTEGYAPGQNLTLEDMNIENDCWEVEPDPPAEKMEIHYAMMGAVTHGDEKMGQLFAMKGLIQSQRANMDEYPHLKNDLIYEQGIAEVEKEATKLLFEVANRGSSKPDTPDWMLQYRALLLEGEKEKAEYLWDAEICKGLQSIQERMLEPLREMADKHLKAMSLDEAMDTFFPGLRDEEDEDKA